MGTWGTGLFDSDGAMDWVVDFLDHPKPALVKETLDRLKDPSAEDWDEALDESRDEVLAAAELIAAMRGKPSSELPDDLEEWVEANRGKWAADPLVKPAAAVIKNIIEHADDILGSWFQEEDGAAWLKNVEDLAKRLS